MPSRRDQLQSHQYLLQRVVSAFVTWETDPVRSPFRRAAGASFAGAMVLVLSIAAAGVYGLLRPGGGGQWRTDGTVVVEKDTGAVYLYRNQAVYPVLNYTSALLLARPDTAPVSVGRSALMNVPRGVTIGIPGAPTSLPALKDLTTGDWVLCAHPGLTPAGASTITTSLAVGGPKPAGEALGDEGVLVRSPDSRTVDLVWHGQRHVLADDTLEALALTQSPEMVVSAALLNTVPRGADLRAPQVSGAGSHSSVLPGARIGQVLRVRSGAGTEEFYLVEGDALQPVTPLEAAILLGSADLAKAYRGVPAYVDTSPARIAALTASQPAPQPDALDAPPPADTAPALHRRLDVRLLPRRRRAAHPHVGSGGVHDSGGSTEDPAAAGTDRLDEVMVEPGHAALVEAMTSATAQDGALTLVTDTGMRFAIPDPQVIADLGYAGAPISRLPSALVSRITAGPALDSAAAARAAMP